MTRPLIAVAAMRSERVRGLRYTGAVAAEAVLEAVAQAGGEPVVLPCFAGGDATTRLRRFDAIVLPGGADVDPVWYEAPSVHPETQPADHLQDAADIALARAALAADMPMLAICRGMQVLNVAAGGTLIQHLDARTVDHHQRHHVTLDAESRLAGLLGVEELTVSSYHHQAVDHVAPGFRPVAWAADGCIEAIESDDHRALCVQWHPEDDAPLLKEDHVLFTALVDRALDYRDASADRRHDQEGAA